MSDIIFFNKKELSGRDFRFLQEWMNLDSLCSKRKKESSNPQKPSISYIIRRKNAAGVPTEYQIWYRCKSIIGVKDTEIPREPIFGFLHKMDILMPNNFPFNDSNPIFTFITSVWHPNIRYSGSFKGHVDLTLNENGVITSLTDLVLQVESYLKYKIYHAENTFPYPEDQNVAEWVREEGEPNGWTSFDQNYSEKMDSVTSK